MAPDPAVLSALESVLAADPASTAVRAHLAALLVEDGQGARALPHLELLLASRPDDVASLALAARAAHQAGDEARAQAWQRLHDALAGLGQPQPPQLLQPSPPPQLAQLPPPAEGDGGAQVPAHEGVGAEPDWDAELAQLVDADRATRVTLADIAGLDVVKARLESSFLGPLRNPELRRMYKTSLRGGLLLWGPPGCGKTFLARAVAGELGAHFFTMGLHEVLDMWLGNSEKKLHDLFEMARRSHPSVLFFDEVDAIGHTRAGPGRGAMRNVVAQLLNELDGVDFDNEGLFVIGATNQPWDVDPALRRPGRFDRSLLVLPPDGPARKAVMEYHLRDRPVSIGTFDAVVAATDGFSGADLRLACEDAAQKVMAEAVRSGTPRPIGEADLLGAARGTRPSTVPWFELARNFATYANSEGEYDELLTYMRQRGKGRR